MKKTLFVLMAAGLAATAQASPDYPQRSLKWLTKICLENEILELACIGGILEKEGKSTEKLRADLKDKLKELDRITAEVNYEIIGEKLRKERPVDGKVCHIEFLDHDTPPWLLKKYGQYPPAFKRELDESDRS